MLEIENLLIKNENSIFCLVETHQKRNNVHVNPIFKYINKIRLLNDKKGGGISIIWNKNNKFKLEEIPSTHSDVLITNVSLGSCSFRMIIIYASTNDENRNKNIHDVIYKNIENVEVNEKLLILGDLNGHIDMLGTQKINLI